MKINERYIKISGRFPIERDLNYENDVSVILKAGTVKREEKNNQDGTVDVIYTVKPIELSVSKENAEENFNEKGFDEAMQRDQS